MSDLSAKSDNVISLFAARSKNDPALPVESTSEDLLVIAERNKRNAERVAKERAAANRSTLRSYRIKH